MKIRGKARGKSNKMAQLKLKRGKRKTKTNSKHLRKKLKKLNRKLKKLKSKLRKELKKKSNKKLQPALTKIGLLIKTSRKRRPILVAVPSKRLYVCKAEGKRFAFLRGTRLLPVGVVQSIKSKRGEKRVLVYPFDSTEHTRVIRAVCR